jgi:hypothetical protein
MSSNVLDPNQIDLEYAIRERMLEGSVSRRLVSINQQEFYVSIDNSIGRKLSLSYALFCLENSNVYKDQFRRSRLGKKIQYIPRMFAQELISAGQRTRSSFNERSGYGMYWLT